MNEKKISVIMGLYNCEDTLVRAIDSIINQTYTNWELIMCDDGSIDQTYSIAQGFVEKYPDKMILLHDDKNMHLAHALNRCFAVATGEYIARMDADDYSLPNRFEKQVAFLDSHPEYILCGTQIRIISELSGKEYITFIDAYPDKYTLHKHTPFNHATIICRREMYEILGGYSEAKTAVRCEDQELWYRFFAKGLTGANLEEALYFVYENKAMIYRVTANSRWNGFVTATKGYRLLHFRCIYFYRPAFNFLKIMIPPKVIIFFKKRGGWGRKEK